ncbi:MAG: histidine phosphatase family protein [Candidatus Binataceae bacterium]
MGALIMVRHGESEGNRDRRFTTTPAVPLTDFGREQAGIAAEEIAIRFEPRRVFTSPYTRARQTAEIIAARLDLPVAVEPNLHERKFGVLAGESYDVKEAILAFDPVAQWFWRPTGGESYEDVRLRVIPVLERIAREYPADEIVIVSHGGAILACWVYVTGNRNGAHIVSNCGMVVFEHDAGVFSPPSLVEQ